MTATAADELLSTGEVCDLTGLDLHVLNDWVVKGIVKPLSGGSRSGDHRRWTTMQAVGLVIAAELRTGLRGCALSFVQRVYEAFAGMPERDLRKLLEKGRTAFVTVHDGKPWLAAPDYDWPSVLEAYEAVRAKFN